MIPGDNELYHGMGTRSHWKRRIWHLSMGLSLTYYLVPDTIFKFSGFEFNKNLVVLVLFFVIAGMEFLRLSGRWTIDLFRDYERNRISAPFWFTSTAALIIIVTPQWFAVPVVLSVTFGDPVFGELRRLGIRSGPIFGLIVCMIPFLFYSYNIALAFVLAFIATASELLMQKVDVTKTFYPTGIHDDNFTMQFFPALTLGFIWLLSINLGLELLPPGVTELLSPIY